MISEIEYVIHQSMEVFLENTAKEFDVPLSKLKENWKLHLQSGDVKKKTTAKKSSLYQNFFVQKRAELIRAQPDLKFGDLSSQISKLWNDMTKEAQKDFAHPPPLNTVEDTALVSAPPTPTPFSTASTLPPPPSTVPVPVPVPVPGNSLDFDSLNKKTMPELKKLCEEKGLKRTGNKLTLIQNLMGMVALDPPPKKKLPMVPTLEEMEDVEVVVDKDVVKRADIEEDVEVTFSDGDEEDFEFEEGSNYSVTAEDDD